MSRFCVRQRAAGQEAEEVNWNPTSSESRPIEAAPWKNISSGTDGNEVDVEGGKADTPRSSRIPGDTSPHYPEAIPVPASPSLSVHVQLPKVASSFDRNREQSESPVVDRTPYDELTRDKLHERCTERGSF